MNVPFAGFWLVDTVAFPSSSHSPRAIAGMALERFLSKNDMKMLLNQKLSAIVLQHSRLKGLITPLFMGRICFLYYPIFD